MDRIKVDERSVRKSLKSKFQLLLMVIVVSASAVIIYAQVKEIHNIRVEAQAVQKSIDKEMALNEKLKNEIEAVKSDELVERIARDVLGLIKEGDIIFVRPR